MAHRACCALLLTAACCSAFVAVPRTIIRTLSPSRSVFRLSAVAASAGENISRVCPVELLPYVQKPVAWEPLGPSRYSKELKEKIDKKAETTRPLLVSGEPGTRKTYICGLIHKRSGSPLPALLVHGMDVTVDPTLLFGAARAADGPASGASGVDGRGGGMLDVAKGLNGVSLILEAVDILPRPVVRALKELVVNGTYRPWRGNGANGGPDATAPARNASTVRLMFTAELPKVVGLEVLGKAILSVPLRVRKADLQAEADYYVRRYCNFHNLPVPVLSYEAINSLAAYDFKANVKDLETMMERAVIHAGRNAKVLERETIWPPTWEDKLMRFRWNLLSWRPLREFVRSDFWPNGINWGFTVWVYPLYVASLFLGPQDRDHSIFLTGFWSVWWPCIMVSYTVVGRVWCSVCPFMIYGELAQKVRETAFSFLGPLKKWPRESLEVWGPWFVYASFLAILLWEELWNLPQVAYLSGWLLLIITGGAMACSVVFERRLFCRFLCPIGGMHGLFAKLSVTDVRADRGICSANCDTFHCYKGGPSEEGIGRLPGKETNGCPLYSHPAQLLDSKNCVNCMTCVKACPNESVGFYVRPPCYEITCGTNEDSLAEASLIYLMLGNPMMRIVPDLLDRMGFEVTDSFLLHTAACFAALMLPLAVGWLVHVFLQAPALETSLPGSTVRPAGTAAKRTPSSASGALFEPLRAGSSGGGGGRTLDFTRMSYGYVPLAWAANLAYWSHLFLTEVGKALPITAASFGLDSLAGALPSYVLDHEVLQFIQLCVVLFGGVGSVWLTALIAKRDLREIVPQIAAIAGLDALVAALVLGMPYPT